MDMHEFVMAQLHLLRNGYKQMVKDLDSIVDSNLDLASASDIIVKVKKQYEVLRYKSQAPESLTYMGSRDLRQEISNYVLQFDKAINEMALGLDASKRQKQPDGYILRHEDIGQIGGIHDSASDIEEVIKEDIISQGWSSPEEMSATLEDIKVIPIYEERDEENFGSIDPTYVPGTITLEFSDVVTEYEVTHNDVVMDTFDEEHEAIKYIMDSIKDGNDASDFFVNKIKREENVVHEQEDDSNFDIRVILPRSVN